MVRLRHPLRLDPAGTDASAHSAPPPDDGRIEARTTRPMTQPVGAEEGVGLLFRNGAFLTSVRYTLVAFENERDGSSAERTVVYTAVLHFESAASECSRLLDGGGHLLALETAQGLRMACRPVEALGASRLRWIVRLT